MRVHFGNINSGNVCVFTVGNRVATYFNAEIIPQLIMRGGDVKGDLFGMLSQAAAKTGLDMNAQNTQDLTDVVDKYVDLISQTMQQR